jgi:predicted transcriptional regulator
MNTVKEQAIELIKSLPDDCTLEDIQYHLYVREKVEQGIQAINEGRVVPQEDAERKVQEWLKLSGQKMH